MKTSIAILAVSVALCLAAAPAGAHPVYVYTEPDPVQDDWIIEGEYDELGLAPTFPADELLASVCIGTTNYDPCPAEKETGTNFVIAITNLTSKAYEDVYYVADPETDLTNWDEWVGNPVWGTDHEKAFRIDYIGENIPLISEDGPVNGIWEPGETWEFVIQDYTNTLALAPHLFGSLGIASVSAAPDQTSSGSIIVPEPASLSLLALGALVAIRRRRR